MTMPSRTRYTGPTGAGVAGVARAGGGAATEGSAGDGVPVRAQPVLVCVPSGRTHDRIGDVIERRLGDVVCRRSAFPCRLRAVGAARLGR